MPGNLTDLNAFTSPITVPADGDAEAAASVITAFQALANRTANVRSGVQGIASAITARVPLSPVYNLVSIFVAQAGATNVWLQTTTGSSEIRFMIPHTVTGKINSISVRCAGGTGAQHAALPATMPLLRLLSIDLTTAGGTQTVVSSVTDPSASVGAYETVHTLTLAAIAQTISANQEYVISLAGETGANSVANAFRFSAIEVGFTP